MAYILYIWQNIEYQNKKKLKLCVKKDCKKDKSSFIHSDLVTNKRMEQVLAHGPKLLEVDGTFAIAILSFKYQSCKKVNVNQCSQAN